MTDLYGWVGKILNVDLTSATVTTVPTSKYAPKWIGGRGLGAKIHWDMVAPDVKAFDPENVLTFMTGPLAGVTCCRTYVQGVSPAAYPVESIFISSFGGNWAPELKFAGYDGIIIQGKSAKPVYLLIEDGDVEIRDASTLWGLDTYATQENLWSRHGEEFRVATIGPAGERLVRDAIILTDDSSASGMGGFGAVMGFKNLKAIAVRGTGSIPVAKPEELLELQYEVQRLLTRKEGEAEPSSGLRGARQWADPSLFLALSEEATDGTARIGFSGCFGCPIHCGMSVKFMDGSEVGSGNIKCVEASYATKEVEYYGETLFGRPQYARLKLQDRLGLSQDEYWYFYLDYLLSAEVLTAESLGIPYEVGSLEFGRELAYKTAYREGIGDKIAEGMARFCNDYLKTDAAIKKYEEIAVKSGKHRASVGWHGPLGAAYYGIPGLIQSITANNGGPENRGLYARTHLPYFNTEIAEFFSDEYFRATDNVSKQLFGSEQAFRDMRALKRSPYDVPIAIWNQDVCSVRDSFTRCFYTEINEWDTNYTPDHLAVTDVARRLYSAVTGIDMDEEGEKTFANRLYMLERAILTRQGHTREDDWTFDWMFEALKEATNILGEVVKDAFTKDSVNEMLDEYYTARGMDLATGLPKRSTLENLDLKDVADDLETKYAVTVPA